MLKVGSLISNLLAVLQLECLAMSQPITGREPKPVPFTSLPQEILNSIIILSSLLFFLSRGCYTLFTLFPYKNSIYIFISVYELHAHYTSVCIILSGNELSPRILEDGYRSGSQNISRLQCNPEACYDVDRSLALDRILSQISPVHTHKRYLFKGYFTIIAVLLLHKPGYLMLCVGNRMEENSSVSIFEFPTGI